VKILHVSTAYGYWGRLRPDCLDREDIGGGQVGGGETAMLNACFQLAALGHEVHSAFRCRPGHYRGVRFYDLMDAHRLASEEDWDVVVSWDDGEFLLPLVGEKPLRVLSNQMNHIAPWTTHAVDIFVSPSRTHARLMSSLYEIPLEKFCAIPNGIDPSRFDFEGICSAAGRDWSRVYYASSPDRGLHHLLQLWPSIRREIPEAHLHVYYEMDRWIAGTAIVGGWNPECALLATRVKGLREVLGAKDGVFFEGAVHPRRCARDASRSGIMAYPCDTVFFTEGFGTAVLESYVAGALPVVTDTDAFAEVYGEAVPLLGAAGEENPLVSRARIMEDFAPRVVQALRIMRERQERKLPGWGWDSAIRAGVMAQRLSWESVGKLWQRLVESEGRDRPWWPRIRQADKWERDRRAA
jgi:glycosyltransferase involved in cell wall biosynthesis